MNRVSFASLEQHVRDVLLRIWDPIGIVDMGGPEDEYDQYVPEIVALVRDPSVYQLTIVGHLLKIESEQIGLPPSKKVATDTARALLGLRSAMLLRRDNLVRQILSPDFRFAVWTFERLNGEFYIETASFKELDADGEPSHWRSRGTTGSVPSLARAQEIALKWERGLWGETTEGPWTNAGLREGIIAYLELASSFDRQREYENTVPIAHVPSEMIEMWSDHVDEDFLSDYHEPVFSPDEQTAVREFHLVWISVIRDTPDELPCLSDLVQTEPWQRLRLGADRALQVFLRRGRNLGHQS